MSSSEAPFLSRDTTIETPKHDPYVPYAPGTIPWMEPELQQCFPPAGPVHTYMHWVTQTTHSPTVFHLAAYLANLAHRLAALGLRVEVQGVTKRPRIYTLLVAPSGVGKSTPISRALNFFEDLGRQSTTMPVAQSVAITADSTPNGIQRILHESKALPLTNELGLFVCEEAERLFTKSRQHPVDALFCSLFDGNGAQHVTAKNLVDVKKGDDKLTKLHAPIVSLLFAMPEASFTAEGMERASDAGLIPRFLVFRGAERAPKEAEQRHEEGRAIALSSLDQALVWWEQIRSAIAVGEQPWPGDPDDGCIRVRFSQGARDVYAERVSKPEREAYERRARGVEQAETHNFRSYRTRAYDQAYIIAALYAICSGTAKQGLSPQAHLVVQSYEMEWALNFVDFSTKYMETILPQLGVREEVRTVFDVESRVRTAGPEGLTEREILNAAMHRGVVVSDTMQALQDLLSMGRIAKVEFKPTGTRGRPKATRYVIAQAPAESEDA